METSLLIYSKNQLTGFFIVGTLRLTNLGNKFLHYCTLDYGQYAMLQCNFQGNKFNCAVPHIIPFEVE